jgi:tetratricopeptide (TPR) repeat protein
MRYSRRFVALISAVLLAAVLLPFAVTGYAEIDQAESAYANNDFARASELYLSAARHLPWRTDLWEQAGLAASKHDDFPNAIALLERAPRLSEEGWLALGYSYYLSGDMEAAQQAFEEGLSDAPASSLYSGLAHVHRAQKNWVAERAALQSQLQTDGSNTYAHYRLGLLLTVLDSELALTELMLAASLDPAYDPAVQTLRAALELSVTQTDPSQQMVTIGRALGLVQEWELSLSAFEAALAKDEGNAEAWAWLGEAKQQTGGDGRVELDKALMLDGQSAIVRALRGLYWNRQGKFSQSLAEYLLAAGIEPENPAWQASIGEAYVRLGDLASALTAYRKATELAPEQPAYWRLLAIVCAENNTWVEEIGLPAAQKAAELAPKDVAVLDTLGWSYLASRRYYTAEQTLLSAIVLEPDYLPAHLHLALTYLAQGDQASAFDKLVYIRDADPEGATGKFASQLLGQYFP